MVVVTMKTIARIVGCLVFLSLAACGTDGSGDGARTNAVSSTPAGHDSGTTTGSPVAKATATISIDGLLFVGADNATVGTTISVTVTNETTGPITVTLRDPAGATADTAQVVKGGTAQITAVANAAGKWTVKIDGEAIEGGMSKAITVI
jgi:hypothetical protein